MEQAYGIGVCSLSPSYINEKIEKAIENSVVYVEREREIEQRRKQRRREEDGEEVDWLPYEYKSPDMAVSSAANIERGPPDRQKKEAKQRFGCHDCLKVIEASPEAPVLMEVVVQQWQGWPDPFGPPRLWAQVSVRCAACAEWVDRKAEEDRIVAEELREYDRQQAEQLVKQSQKRQAETNRERQSQQKKRLASEAAKESEGGEGVIVKLGKLRLPRLKALCQANSVLLGGSKDQLVERLLSVYRYGNLRCCPKCGSRKFEFQHDGESPTPFALRCKHMKGMGRHCGFEQTLSKLTAKLRDTTEKDLAGVGIQLSESDDVVAPGPPAAAAAPAPEPPAGPAPAVTAPQGGLPSRFFVKHDASSSSSRS
uniref:SAP domain-containing protein n=1 Tax=Chromera velia CCMP2878 TaxID=1169474 RepID=A0A0G4FI60_9ALVE|eukprot:Cvel_17130.t1-p1 / transcript=Cvel_17130.t1 / gene=Cvel_17130 / organism=Chromera_velia_CCMP2878 / gene_product=hypothetical protein / transcript_product=hypothetical protein / location=Cvel_scaffold1351:46855-47955(-) / protein_length=367 / sequence_SO=supercontig / SO=protein_coding / is_pseudo=false